MASSSDWLYPSVLVAVVLVCYHNSLQCGFVFDDASAIKDNKDLRPETPLANIFWNDFWGTPMNKERSHKSYRPLCVLTFRLNYALSELAPMSYHLVNNLLHATVCLLFFRLCRMFMNERTSFIAALMFAVHPVHTEAVTGVVGRAELLSSIFYILALITYTKSTGYRANTAWRPLSLTVALVAVAMLCKEQGITVIGVCCVYEVFIAQRMTLKYCLTLLRSFVTCKKTFPPWLWTAILRTLALVGATVGLLVARIKVMGAQLPVFTRFDNPASMAPFPAKHLTFNYLLPVNSWLLLNPAHLCCDWTMGTIPLVESLLDARNLATVVFYLVLFKIVHYGLTEKGRRPKAVIMSVSLLVLPFIPATNLFFPVGFVVAERILYAPSMGFCMLAALGWDAACQHRRQLWPLLYALMAALILTHSMKTITRNTDWESEYTLFKAALRVNRHNAKLFNNVGHALEGEKNFGDALQYFVKATEVQPDDIGAHINVGRTHNNLANPAEAEKAYRHALSLLPPVKPGHSYTARIAPNHLNVFINLGNLISKDASRLLEADALYRTAISMRADFIQAYINRGDILMKLNRTSEALEQYQTALRYEDDNSDLYYNLGVVHLELGKKADAFHFFERALVHNPNHKQTLFNSAILRQEIGDPKLRPEAYKRLHKLLLSEPDNEKAYFNLGMLAMDDHKYDDAKGWFDKAIQLRPDFRSALFNQALMLNNDLHRPRESVPYLQQLLKYFPDHTKGLILMGDININQLKDLAAAETNFRSILEREPNHVQANHNLCVVFVERGELEAAERCLVHTARLAPDEAYIQNHLNIVRGRIYKVQQQQQQQQQQQKQAKSSDAKNENSATAGHRSNVAEQEPKNFSEQSVEEHFLPSGTLHLGTQLPMSNTPYLSDPNVTPVLKANNMISNV